MKNLNLISIFLIGFLFVAISANATGVGSQFNEYEITSVEDVRVGKNVEAIWTLSYSEDESAVTVLKRKTLEGSEYIVQNDHFAVSYAVTVHGFGVKQVRKAWTNVPRQITNAVISKSAMAQQTVITPNKVDDMQALKLIASYLPDLINESYTHLLN